MSFHEDINNLIIMVENFLADTEYALETRQMHIRNSSRYMAPEYKKMSDDTESELIINIQHCQYILSLLSNIKNGHVLSSHNYYYLETISFMQNFLSLHHENISIHISSRRNTA